MKTKIVVDSSSNLYELPGAEFACVPLKIVTDEQEYLDDGHLDAVDMAQTLRSYKGKFGPEWRSRFIAAPVSTPLPLALLDVALLTSGGWLGLLGWRT